MVRPTKEIRLKEVSGGFQVLRRGVYVGRVSYRNLLLLAVMNRGYGTDEVMAQLAQLCETIKKRGLGTENEGK